MLVFLRVLIPDLSRRDFLTSMKIGGAAGAFLNLFLVFVLSHLWPRLTIEAHPMIREKINAGDHERLDGKREAPTLSLDLAVHALLLPIHCLSETSYVLLRASLWKLPLTKFASVSTVRLSPTGYYKPLKSSTGPKPLWNPRQIMLRILLHTKSVSYSRCLRRGDKCPDSPCPCVPLGHR